MWLTKLLGAAAAVATAGVGLLWWFQERLIYIPKIPGVPDEIPFYPDRFGLDYEDVWLTAADGVKLHAWLLRPPAGGFGAAGSAVAAGGPPRARGPLLIFFQENAGNMAMRLPFLRLLVRNLGCAVLAPSYRGYGLSAGSPTEAGLRLDADAALDHALGRADVDPRRVGVFGRSLGGAVALALAAARPDQVAATIVENTFLSIEALVPSLLPFLAPFIGPGRPFNRLLRNTWHNAPAARALTGRRVLLISSLADEMLPPAHMAALWRELGGGGGDDGSAPPPPFAAFVPIPGGRHMDAYDACAADYWPPLVAFAQAAGVAASGTTPAGSAMSG